jgi:hypothetical protein
MPAASVVSLLLVLVTVAVLAAALVRVALLLKHVNFTLGEAPARAATAQNAEPGNGPLLVSRLPRRKG